MNVDELLHGDVEAKKIVLKLLETVLDLSDPYKAVINSVKLEGDILKVRDKSFPIKNKVYVLGFGKASCSMAKALEDLMIDKI